MNVPTNENVTQLLIIRGVIASESPENQAKIMATADKLRAVINEAGDVGMLALALVGAESAAQD